MMVLAQMFVRKMVVYSAAVCMVALGFSCLALPAQGHDQLISQSPAPGEHLEVAPGSVRLTFTNPPLDIGAVIVVADVHNWFWQEGDPVLSERTFVQKLEDDIPDGRYQVRWRVVSGDGHPISESFFFSIGEVNDDDDDFAEDSGVQKLTPDEGSERFVSEGWEKSEAQNEEAEFRLIALRISLLALGGGAFGLGVFVLVMLALRRTSRHRDKDFL